MTEHDATDVLRSRAERGTPRGADAVLAGARSGSGPTPITVPGPAHRSHRWRVSVAAAVLIGAAAVGAIIVRSSPAPPAPAAGGGACADLLVYLDLGLADTDREAIESDIRAGAGVASVTYLDQDVMYERFRRLFRDEPVLLENVRPSDIPTAFAVEAADPSDTRPLAELESTMRRRDGVMEVRALPIALRCASHELPDFTDSAGNKRGFATATTDPTRAAPPPTTTVPATTTTASPATSTSTSTTATDATTTVPSLGP